MRKILGKYFEWLMADMDAPWTVSKVLVKLAKGVLFYPIYVVALVVFVGALRCACYACYACYVFRGEGWYDKLSAMGGLLLLVVAAYYIGRDKGMANTTAYFLGRQMEAAKSQMPMP